jgi:hypothetical protein
MRPTINTYTLYWSPEGRPIVTVRASTMRLAIRRAPMPYRRFKGEIYAIDETVTDCAKPQHSNVKSNP